MALVGVEIFGVILTLWGLAGWTGRYRGWTRLTFGFMIFAALPAGVGFQLLVFGVVTGIRIVGLIGAGAILFVAVPLALLAPNIIGPAWYSGSKIRLGHRDRSR